MAEAVHSSTSNIARLIDCTGHPELCSRLLKGKKIYCIKNKYINNNYYLIICTSTKMAQRLMQVDIYISLHLLLGGGGGIRLMQSPVYIYI